MRHFSNGLDGDWNRVTETTPCPICGSAANCRTHAEEAFVCCVQQPSDWRLSNGGWLHRKEISSAKVARNIGRHRVDFGKAEAVPSGVVP